MTQRQIAGVADRLWRHRTGKEATRIAVDGEHPRSQRNVQHMWIAAKKSARKPPHPPLRQIQKNSPLQVKRRPFSCFNPGLRGIESHDADSLASFGLLLGSTIPSRVAPEYDLLIRKGSFTTADGKRRSPGTSRSMATRIAARAKKWKARMKEELDAGGLGGRPGLQSNMISGPPEPLMRMAGPERPLPPGRDAEIIGRGLSPWRTAQ